MENFRRKRAPTSKKGFKCWKCRKGFKKESELNIHMQNPCEPIHSNSNLGEPNQYKDGECSEEFSHEWMLKEYLEVHWEVGPFQCEHCDLEFKRERELTSHMKKYHESENEAYFSKQESKKDFEMWKCSRKCTNESELNIHMQNPCEQMQNKTDQCPQEFSNDCRVNEVPEEEAHNSQRQTRTDGRENALRKLAPTSKKVFKCWNCRKGFTNESEFNIHMQNPCEPKHGKLNLGKPNQYKCGGCFEEFSYEWKLKEHLVVHWEVKPFECEHCDLAFKWKNHLTSHMNKYHKSETEAYFSKKESKKEFECRNCRKGFTNESELNIHMQNPCEPKHGKLNLGKPNQYKCGGCSEEFSHEWKLKEHLVVHWEEKPFECEYCDLAFKWKNHLTSHMNKYHESEMEVYFSKQEAKKELKCGNVQESVQVNRN
ncbi:Zinc finger protein 99 [Araneus ventricosus]|uniref:Zinc finger protein 99 n=1 Tax=Araneus ventricosus TaxID=182803 RepID=A0A4Y2UHV9_ARAVE|nr:Zinc finger protein 99 [Araneus ventricosus]